MKIALPEAVEKIIHTLEEHGFEAYAVGGCVRDSILGKKPADWDITTSAKPEMIKSLFPKTIDTGLQHGTVTVMKNHVGYEVTTYRIDGEYEDHRHPKSVEYTDELKKDLERRDFTINAMAYNHKRGLVDIFNGAEDLERKIIRCVGEAGARFDEDALRMLRAVRFSSQLDFEIEENTRNAILPRVSKLQFISAERIRVELTKLLVGKNAGMLREAYQTGMTAFFLPELDAIMDLEQQNPHHVYTVGEHTIYGIEVMNALFHTESAGKDFSFISEEVRSCAEELIEYVSEKQRAMLCLTMLFHDMGKAETKTVDEKGIGHFYGHQAASEKIAGKRLRALTYDNETVKTVKALVKFHDIPFGDTEKSMRKLISKVGEDLMQLLFLVRFCDIYAQNPEYVNEKISSLLSSIDRFRRVLDSKAAFSIRDLDITGKELIAEGMKPGPEIGTILNELLERVLENPEENERENLLKIVKEKRNSAHKQG